jgi:hypothetical protein
MATYKFLTPTLQQGLIGNHRLFQFFAQRDKGYTVINNAGVYSLTQYPAQDDLETYTAYYMGGLIHTGITDAIRTAMIAAGIGITADNFTAE